MRICYIGFYDKSFVRNIIITRGLAKAGVGVDEVNFKNKNFKYFRITYFLFKNSRKYDLIFCAYPGYTTSIIASLISQKIYKIPTVCDATSPYQEQAITSRKKYSNFHPKRYLILILDWLVFHLNNKIYLESAAQLKYCQSYFKIKREKLGILYSGADEISFLRTKPFDSTSSKIIFRGKAMNEVGFEYIFSAIKLLGNSGIDFKFLIAGDKKIVERSIEKFGLSPLPANIKIDYGFFPKEKILTEMSDALMSLGQFSDNPRVDKTIPYKGYESLALGIPYLTAKSEAVSEIMLEEQNCFFVEPNNSESLAAKIKEVIKNRDQLASMSQKNQTLFREKFSSEVIGIQLKEELNVLVDSFKK